MTPRKREQINSREISGQKKQRKEFRRVITKTLPRELHQS